MQIVRWISLLSITALTVWAEPVQYQIDFTPAASSANVLDVSGQYVFDSASDSFSSFTVTVDSLTFDFLPVVSSPANFDPTACTEGGNALSFALLTQTLSNACSGSEYEWNFFADSGALIFEFVAGNIQGGHVESLGLTANVILDQGCLIDQQSCTVNPIVQEFGTYTSTIPEPTLMPLLSLGLIMLVVLKKRRFAKVLIRRGACA